jgi:hypothetical protein
MRIFQRQQVGERDQRPHSLHLLQSRYLRITFAGDLRDLLVVFVNPLAERPNKMLLREALGLDIVTLCDSRRRIGESDGAIRNMNWTRFRLPQRKR